MAYLAQSDLELAYGQSLLLNVATDGAGGVDVGRVARANEAAQATIDMALRGRYAVPFSAFPAELRGIAQALAWHQLWLSASEMPDGVESARKAAIAQLDALAAGRAQLPADVPRPSTGATQGASTVYTAGRTLTYGDDWAAGYTL